MPNPNPNMSGLKSWQKGSSGNPGGKTSEQKRIELRNAETAMRIREKLLAALEDKIETIDACDNVIEFIEGATLKLLKDAEDRGLGAPVQDVRSGDGSMSPPQRIEIIAVPGDDDT